MKALRSARRSSPGPPPSAGPNTRLELRLLADLLAG